MTDQPTSRDPLDLKIESAFFTFVVSISYLKILILKFTKELPSLLTYYQSLLLRSFGSKKEKNLPFFKTHTVDEIKNQHTVSL